MTQTKNEELKRLRELIEKIELAMMVTQDGEELRARPMTTSQMDESGHLWFFTNEFSSKTGEILEQDEVNLSYADKESNSYVSIGGKASLVHDQNKVNELWNPILKAWFPEGKEDPDLALIRVIPHSAEFWDSNSSKMVQLFKISKAILKGESYQQQAGDDENAKLDL
ncbi:pyridoxamine 5'-phosphate oxidase family protein [Litoribacter alkaliphilus]|uniref:Pyridoxamine 5'-phosphate oxidase family protein n=1 Tax=Litoribacter ruber TaxID=702568 RepID=A0AAP2CJ68_9BACT|nr:pyridoxamine 5'-phosphate oxidase family protein [Litoribacter alkaliphilus]MBS9524875.1 pyridoxamine 5'-phosphate oxidase family protein [Litoribacter alkaliphilus]